MVSSRPKFEIEEISQKFNFLLKGTVSGKFLKTFQALNKCPVKNDIKKYKMHNFKTTIFPSRGPLLCSEI